MWVRLTAPVVRPWKAPPTATMPLRPVRRESLIAVSTASEPLLQKKTPDPWGACATRSSASAASICAGVVKKLLTWTSSPACLEIAATSSG